jgi:hypothetical protein
MGNRVVLLAALSLSVAGCGASAVGSPAGLTGVASMIASVGSTATGFKTVQSTAELNGANKELAEAQTAMMRTQVEQTKADHDRIGTERTVTAKLLREMSTTYHEPMFETLAAWVQAGGDPDFAFKYAIAHVDDENKARIASEQTLLLKQQPALVGPSEHPPEVPQPAAPVPKPHPGVAAEVKDAPPASSAKSG